MTADHRARALAKLADRYGIDPEGEDMCDARVGEWIRHPVTIPPFIAVTEHIAYVGSDDPECSPYDSWFQFAACDDPGEPIEAEEKFYDCDWHPHLCGVVDLDRWAIAARSVRGWDTDALPE